MCPYIKKTEREKFRNEINCLNQRIENVGDLNYVITKLLLGYVHNNGEKYKTYNDVMGVMNCSNQEFYRRFISIYEDKKIADIENGDII
jgi:hypothetical protein